MQNTIGGGETDHSDLNKQLYKMIAASSNTPTNFHQTVNPVSDGSSHQQASFHRRNGSFNNMKAQRKAVALYNAPVVKERYKRVASHFNKPKNSQVGTLNVRHNHHA